MGTVSPAMREAGLLGNVIPQQLQGGPLARSQRMQVC